MMKSTTKQMKETKNSKLFRLSVEKMTMIALFSAVSVILVYLLHVPLFPPPVAFLEYDMADVPIIMLTFLYGPYAGFLTTIIVSIIQGLTVSAQSGWIGILMHIAATGSYVLVAGMIYKRRRGIKWEVVALTLGTAAMTAVMVLWNLIMTPLFMGWPIEEVLPLIVPFIMPFNLIKAGGNSIIAYFVFKLLIQALKHTKLGNFIHHT